MPQLPPRRKPMHGVSSPHLPRDAGFGDLHRYEEDWGEPMFSSSVLPHFFFLHPETQPYRLRNGEMTQVRPVESDDVGSADYAMPNSQLFVDTAHDNRIINRNTRMEADPRNHLREMMDLNPLDILRFYLNGGR